MSIVQNGQLIPSGGNAIYVSHKLPSQKYERVKQFDQAVSHGFMAQTTHTS